MCADTMRWQKTLTKAQLKHLREYQDTLTLREFKLNRIAQKKFEVQMRESGLFAPACGECNEIETRLLRRGVKL
jgi:hypothetical protein